MPAKYLVIVESPGKIKKIQSFLSNDYVVSASVGHIRDLVTSREHRLGVDIENDFKPIFGIDPKKRDVVNRLKTLKQGKTVILAADEDREGEAIAESLRDELRLRNDSYFRILFNEITKSAILKAINHPTTINKGLVEAQLTRRILDRLVGFELSPLLKKIPELVESGRHTLGTGRVQSVVVRLIVEREEEIERFLSHLEELYFLGSGQFEISLGEENFDLSTELLDLDSDQVEIKDVARARECLKGLLESEWKVSNLEVKTSCSKPSAPFTTSTLQQDASSRLGFSVKKTMSVAQKLYEGGHITYMRTDSTTLSDAVLNDCRDLISEQFGKDDHHYHQYTTRSKSAQEAHEAVRPTQVKLQPEGEGLEQLDNDMRRLYKLIWERTVASQMRPARYSLAEITLTNGEYLMRGTVKQLLIPGHLRVKNRDLVPEIDEETAKSYRELQLDEIDVNFLSAKLAQHLQQPPSRFSEASLVKRLEQLGIGRPSTYVTIITKVQEHEYIEVVDHPGERVVLLELNGQVEDKEITETQREGFLGKASKRLTPTLLGRTVNSFLLKNFKQIIDYDFTSKMETSLDEIANSEETRSNVLTTFYQTFQQLAKQYLATKPPPLVKQDGETVKPKGDLLKKWQELFTLTVDKDQYRVYLGKTRYGTALRLIDIDLTEEESRTQKQALFLNWNSAKKPTENEVAKMVEMRQSGRVIETSTTSCVVKQGPYGNYIQTKDGRRITLPANVDLETVTEEQIEELVTQASQKTIKTVGQYQVRNGPHGPYIQAPAKTKKGKPQFTKIPDDYKPEELEEEDIKKIIEEQSKLPKKTYTKTAKPKPKAKAKKK